MRAQDVMTKGVVNVAPAVPAEEAWQLMRTKQIHHLLVGTLSKPIGILSAHDLGGRAGAAIRKGRNVEDLMETDVATVGERDPVRKIANVMRGRSTGCVLVTGARRVSGIITVADLLELIGRGSDRPMRLTERPPLHARVAHRHRSGAATGVW